MESAERLSPASSRTSSRGESRRGNFRRAGTAAVTAHLLGRLYKLPLLLLALLSPLAKIGPSTAVLAQLSTDDVESSPLEGTACNTTLYVDWYDLPYSGALLVDLVDFWIFSDAELTNGQVHFWNPSICDEHPCLQHSWVKVWYANLHTDF